MCSAAVLFGSASAAHEGVDHDIQRASERLKEEPGDVAALVHRGHLYRLAGKHQLSLADLNRARALAPRDLGMLLQRGLTLSTLERDEASEVELLTYVKLGGDAPRAYAELGHLAARGGRAHEAIHHYRHSLTLHPDVDVYLALGKLFEDVGQLEGAFENYRTGLDKTGAELLLRALVQVEVARGRHAEALGLIDAQIAKDPVAIEWRLERAAVLSALARAEEARAERRRALEESNRLVQHRGTAMDLTLRARAHLALGHRQAARRDVEAALGKVADFAPARELLKATANKEWRPNAEERP